MALTNYDADLKTRAALPNNAGSTGGVDWSAVSNSLAFDSSGPGSNPNPMYNINGDGAATNTAADIRRMEVTGNELSPFAQLIRGTMSFSPDRLRELDPSYTGYSHVFVLRIPPVLTVPAAGNQIEGFEGAYADGSIVPTGKLALAHAKNLRLLFEMGCTSYSGTPELTLNNTQVNVGWSDRQYVVPTYSAYDSTTFTLRCLELRNDLLRHGIEYYISALADPALKASHMNGAIESAGESIGNRLLAPSLTNYTWTFMIVQTDQTLLNIQDISMWQNVIINGVDRSNLDWTNGEIDIVQPRDVTFSGIYVPDSRNPIVNSWARKLLATRLKYYRRFGDMDSAWINESEWGVWKTGTDGISGESIIPTRATT